MPTYYAHLTLRQNGDWLLIVGGNHSGCGTLEQMQNLADKFKLQLPDEYWSAEHARFIKH